MKKNYNKLEIEVISWGGVTDVICVSDQSGQGLKWNNGWNVNDYSITTQEFMD